MPERQTYVVTAEARVVVTGQQAGRDVVVGEFVVRAGAVNGGRGKPQDLVDEAMTRAKAYARAMAAGVENTEARRLKNS